jgi:hypothetical protein
MALVFVPVDVFFPETVSVGVILVELLFAGCACFYGYRIFSHSDEWFRDKQESDIQKTILWRAEHPVLYYVTNYSVVFLVIGYSLIKIYLHKH